ncbi:MAG: DUF2169 domain-containing protein [Planctomycetales bacterium]|nr:DUF2169 domain-containing protein [Planctomycetales bacterium]
MYSLNVVSGEHRSVTLRDGMRCTVGRTPRAQVVLAHDPELSSLHFSIECLPGSVVLRDCQSTNGTFVNDQRISEHRLTNGDQIRAGRTRFVWVETGRPTQQFTGAVAAATHVPAADPNANLAPAPTLHPAAVDQSTSPDQPAGVASNVSGERIQNATPFAVGELLWQAPDGHWKWTIVCKGTWTYAANGDVAPAKVGEPIWADDCVCEQTGEVLRETDLVPFKPRADVIVIGQAYADRGVPCVERDLRLSVGSVTSRLRAIGDRCWKFASRAQLVPALSAAQPWTTIPLSYRRAFGGIDPAAGRYCESNPDGAGFIGALSPQSVHERKLPNFEDPLQLIVSWESKPQPVGWGYYPRNAAPRLDGFRKYTEAIAGGSASRHGAIATYDAFNAAHPLLQQDHYFRGGERVEMVGVSPRGQERFTLPRVAPTLTLQGSDHDRSSPTFWRPDGKSDTRMSLDTLILLPDRHQFVLMWRSVINLVDLNTDVRVSIGIDSRK